MFRVRGKLKAEPGVGTPLWPQPVLRAPHLSLHSHLWSGRGDPHCPVVRVRTDGIMRARVAFSTNTCMWVFLAEYP